MNKYIKLLVSVLLILMVVGQVSFAEETIGNEKKLRDSKLNELKDKIRDTSTEKEKINGADHSTNEKNIVPKLRIPDPVRDKKVEELKNARKTGDKKLADSILKDLIPASQRQPVPREIRKPNFKNFDEKKQKPVKWTNDILVAGTGDTEIRQSIVADSSGNLYIAVEDSTLGNINIYKSTNGGNTWFILSTIYSSVSQPSMTIANDQMLVAFVWLGTDLYVYKEDINNHNAVETWVDYSPSGISDPDIVSDASEYGGGWYSYIAYNWNNGLNWDLYEARSADWSASYLWVYLSNYDASIYPSAPSIDFGGNVLYVGYDNLYAPGDRDVNVLYSDDFGSTWPLWYMAGGTSYDEFGPAVAATKNQGWSTVVVTYTSYRTDYDLMFDYSPDGGNTWSWLWCISCDIGWDEYVADLSTSMSGGKIHAAFWDTWDIDYAKADFTNPTSWTLNYAINEGNYASMSYAPPSVAVNPTKAASDEAILAWTDLRGPTYDVYFDAPSTGSLPLSAEANGPYSGPCNSPISFTGSASGGTPPYSWSWDFGDGGTSTSQNPTHTYATSGAYTAQLTATDSATAQAQDTAPVTVTSCGSNVVVSVNPATQSAVAGNTFSISIDIDPKNQQVAGWQFDLTFDPSLVQVNSLTEENFLKQGGATTFFLPGTIDNVAGKVTGATAAITTPGASVSTPGKAVTIQMSAKAGVTGTSPLNLVNVVIGSPSGTTLPSSPNNGNVDVILDCDRWDVNHDGIANVLDLIKIGQKVGLVYTPPPYIPEDVNKDGKINVLDLIIVGQNIGKTSCWKP